LSRLTDANNPENGHIGYSYDVASNLTTKTDGRFTTTYVYDSLNRVTSRSYSGTPATPSVTYAYDIATNGVGCVGAYHDADTHVVESHQRHQQPTGDGAEPLRRLG
jgi:YD repeat-containing protein